jgi:hypothetical protein
MMMLDRLGHPDTSSSERASSSAEGSGSRGQAKDFGVPTFCTKTRRRKAFATARAAAQSTQLHVLDAAFETAEMQRFAGNRTRNRIYAAGV